MRVEGRDKSIFENKKVAMPQAVVCAVLWGTAVPIVKLSQQKFGIMANDVYSIILFVGFRIFLAGLISIMISSISSRELLLPSKRSVLPIFIAGTVQTVMQHLFLYLGLMHTSGAKGAILSSTTAVIGVIFAHFFMREDRFSLRKGVACIIGFAGIVILNLRGINSQDFTLSLVGDLLIIMSAIFAASGSMISKGITKHEKPIVVSGWQLFLSGIFTSMIGLLGGGRIMPERWSSWLILLYLAFISASAYAIWTTLLKYHEFSKVNIFKSLIPVVGSIVAAFILRENILDIYLIMALIFVSYSAFLVNSTGKLSKNKSIVNRN